MKVDTSKSNISVWLAKLPPFLADKIKKHNNLEFGEIIIKPPSYANGSTSLEFRLCPEFLQAGMPSEYTLKFVEKGEKMYILKQESGQATSIEGYINREIYVNPVQNKKYFEFVKKQTSQIKSAVQPIDYIKEGRQTDGLGSVTELEVLARKRKRLLQSKKRERLEKGEVIDMLFKAFEKHSAWSVRDLADFSGQPVAFIQEIITDICVLNKKDYKNLYELKPEYRQSE